MIFIEWLEFVRERQGTLAIDVGKGSIKNEREHLLVKGDEIRHQWQEYFDKLFNDENTDTTFQLDNSFDDTNRRFVRRI